MIESGRDKILSNLKQARETGQLKTENIRDIVRTAVSESLSELKEGRAEISSLVQEKISAVVEIFHGKEGEVKEQITASIEGAIEAISIARKKSISSTQSEIQILQVKVEKEEEDLHQEIEEILEDIQINSQEKSTQVKEAISEAIHNVKNSDEVILLQRRYAQLKAQLAIIQANLAGRYGENYGDISQYLGEAKTWYEKAKENPEVFTDKVEAKQKEFEQKLGEAGSAIAKREKQIKNLLSELWKSISEIFAHK